MITKNSEIVRIRMLLKNSASENSVVDRNKMLQEALDLVTSVKQNALNQVQDHDESIPPLDESRLITSRRLTVLALFFFVEAMFFPIAEPIESKPYVSFPTFLTDQTQKFFNPNIWSVFMIFRWSMMGLLSVAMREQHRVFVAVVKG
jgi:hypothetical protein